MEPTLDKTLNAFTQLSHILNAVATDNEQLLSDKLKPFYLKLHNILPRLYEENGWFIEQFVKYQLKAIALSTTRQNLEKWLEPYANKLGKINEPKNMAVIMAGNIPFVGFSDFISTLVSGHRFIGKLSSKDKLLPKTIAEILIELEPDFKQRILLTEDLLSEHRFDAIIATGSDNSARYFEYYFAKYPNIIRKNRTSVAVLTGQETDEQLQRLADDIFLYFGLGCRNVSKIFIPENFDLDRLFNAFYKYKFVIDVHKYANNYNYNRAIYLLNREKFYDNGFVLLKPEDIALVSPTAVVFYQRYQNLKTVRSLIDAYKHKIQCIVSQVDFPGYDVVDFGQTQLPMLWQYPDGIDVMQFLLNL